MVTGTARMVGAGGGAARPIKPMTLSGRWAGDGGADSGADVGAGKRELWVSAADGASVMAAVASTNRVATRVATTALGEGFIAGIQDAKGALTARPHPKRSSQSLGDVPSSTCLCPNQPDNDRRYNEDEHDEKKQTDEAQPSPPVPAGEVKPDSDP
jgi:hypothetical protein